MSSLEAFKCGLVFCVGFARLPSPAIPNFSAWAFLPPQAMNFRLEGKITRHAAGRLTVNTQGNIIFHVRYDDKTEIKRQDGSPGSGKDLRVGVNVRVEGELTEAGEVVAEKIDLQSEPASERR